MAAGQTGTDVGWKRLKLMLKAQIWELLLSIALSPFCSLENENTFKLDWAISPSSSSPQLFQPMLPTNLAFETLQILGPHLIFSLKPRCFLVAASCCYWIWRKTNALQAVWLSNRARRRPTYIRWASETAVPTKNLTEGTSVRKLQPARGTTSKKKGITGRVHSILCASILLTVNTSVKAHRKQELKNKKKPQDRQDLYIPIIMVFLPILCTGMQAYNKTTYSSRNIYSFWGLGYD